MAKPFKNFLITIPCVEKLLLDFVSETTAVPIIF